MVEAILRKLDYWRDRLHDRLMRGFPGRTISVECDKPIVSFTFDDVPESALTQGARILEQYDVRGTFYIAGGLADRVEAGRRLISQRGCKKLAKSGHEIACHTFTHIKVPHHDAEAIHEDLDRNAEYLETVDPRNGEQRNFAYPYNAASIFTRDIFASRFMTCRAGGERINRGRVNSAFLSGVEIRQPDEEARGLTRWIDDVVDQHGWLIFFTHDVASKSTPFGCTPQTFEHLVRYAVEKGCAVLPVRDALREICQSARSKEAIFDA